MPYLNLDPNYFDHPKTKRLIGILGPMADVLPIRLWAYCAKFHPQDGKMIGYEANELESILGWPGPQKQAVEALKKVGFVVELESGFSCVDWKQHEGHLAAFSRRGKVAAKARWLKYASSNAKAMQEQCPSRTIPNQPNLTNQTKPNPPRQVDLAQMNFDPGFAAFWAAYPKKIGRASAYAVWVGILPDNPQKVEVILKAIEAQKQAGWFDDLQYVKNPENWLSGGHWDDVVTASDPEGDEGRALARRIMREQRD